MDRRSFIALAASVTAFAWAPRAFAGHSPVFVENGIAIRGADTVAYFDEGGPVAGLVSERVRWRGAVWLFGSQEHREAFEWDPRRFAPRFGGYCAYTLSQGRLAATDPRAFAIHEGRLNLISSLEDREAWLKNLDQNIKLAELNWPSALD
jgi:hypothetical protein